MFRIQGIFRTLPNIYNGIFYLEPSVALTHPEPLVYSELWYILKSKHIRNPAKYLRWSILLRTNGAFSQNFANFFFFKIHKKTPVMKSLFHKVVSLYPATSSKKGLWHRCFLINFAIYLGHLFYKTPPSDCFCSTEKYFNNKVVKNPLRRENNL